MVREGTLDGNTTFVSQIDQTICRFVVAVSIDPTLRTPWWLGSTARLPDGKSCAVAETVVRTVFAMLPNA